MAQLTCYFGSYSFCTIQDLRASSGILQQYWDQGVVAVISE